MMLTDGPSVGFHNGFSYTAFYHKISSNLASKHNQLFRKLPRFTDHVWSDGYRMQSIRPQNLPPKETVLDTARKFFVEINTAVYILNQDRFRRLLESIYVHKMQSDNASLALIYLMLSLWPLDSQYFSDGTNFCNAAIEESSIESVQALMLMVSIENNRLIRVLTGSVGPMPLKSKSATSCLDFFRHGSQNCTDTWPASRQSMREQ